MFMLKVDFHAELENGESEKNRTNPLTISLIILDRRYSLHSFVSFRNSYVFRSRRTRDFSSEVSTVF